MTQQTVLRIRNKSEVLYLQLGDILYILAVLNSSIIAFYYQKQFNSLKILRSHLEALPIPLLNRKKQQPIVDLVRKLLNSTDKKERHELYRLIDQQIAAAYILDPKEYDYLYTFRENDLL